MRTKQFFCIAALLMAAACGPQDESEIDASNTSDESMQDETASSEQALSFQGVRVKCVVHNHFGFVGKATGDLKIKSATEGGYNVAGKLTVYTKFWGKTFKKRIVNVHGFTSNEYAHLVPNSANYFDDFWFYYDDSLDPDAVSSSFSHNNGSPLFQSDCRSSIVNLP